MANFGNQRQTLNQILGQRLLFSGILNDVDYDKLDHQETEFAMDGTEMGMAVAINPDNCSCNTADHGHQK